MNRKFKVHSKEHAKAIINRLEELGYEYLGEDYQMKYIFVYDYCKIVHFSSSSNGYKDHEDSIESTLDDLYKQEDKTPVFHLTITYPNGVQFSTQSESFDYIINQVDTHNSKDIEVVEIEDVGSFKVKPKSS